jgi:hypothetical protein
MERGTQAEVNDEVNNWGKWGPGGLLGRFSSEEVGPIGVGRSAQSPARYAEMHGVRRRKARGGYLPVV